MQLTIVVALFYEFSQNSEFDCIVESFRFRKVDLLFCEIISKPRNLRI